MQVYRRVFYIMLQVVDSLMDIRKTPRKPHYTMAYELPLFLLFYLFDKVRFMHLTCMHIAIFPLNATSQL
jgi:hypothetical protein